MMKYFPILFIAMSLLFSSCGSVPVTGRKQLNLVSNQEVLTISLQQYQQFIKSAPISNDKKIRHWYRKLVEI